MATAISSGRADALHPHRIDQNFHSRRAPPQNIQHVADRRAARRGDNANAFRKFRQRPLARRIEETFGFELAFQGFEFRLQQDRGRASAESGR